MAVNFYFKDVSIKIPERKRLKQFIITLFELEKKPVLTINYVLCSDKFLLSINEEYLNHHDYTDIITFCLSNPGEPIYGEIYISAERVKENACLAGVSINEELHRVIFHGALHLCGFNDKKAGDKKKMTAYENKYLNLYFG